MMHYDPMIMAAVTLQGNHKRTSGVLIRTSRKKPTKDRSKSKAARRQRNANNRRRT